MHIFYEYIWKRVYSCSKSYWWLAIAVGLLPYLFLSLYDYRNTTLTAEEWYIVHKHCLTVVWIRRTCDYI